MVFWISDFTFCHPQTHQGGQAAEGCSSPAQVPVPAGGCKCQVPRHKAITSAPFLGAFSRLYKPALPRSLFSLLFFLLHGGCCFPTQGLENPGSAAILCCLWLSRSTASASNCCAGAAAITVIRKAAKHCPPLPPRTEG